jgi:hypothetical protein
MRGSSGLTVTPSVVGWAGGVAKGRAVLLALPCGDAGEPEGWLPQPSVSRTASVEAWLPVISVYPTQQLSAADHAVVEVLDMLLYHVALEVGHRSLPSECRCLPTVEIRTQGTPRRAGRC